MAKESRAHKINIRERLGHPSGDPAERKVQGQLARIYVAYQDLLLEVGGALNAKDLDAIQFTDEISRRFYFVRRALGTVWEVKQACDVLGPNPAFKARKARFAAHNVKEWDQSVRFFQANQDELKRWRNDMYFTDGVADYVLREMPDSLESEVVTVSDPEAATATVYFPFAWQMVAVALDSTRAEGESREEGLLRAFALMKEAYIRVIRIGHVLTAEVLLKAAPQGHQPPLPESRHKEGRTARSPCVPGGGGSGGEGRAERDREF